MANPYAPPQAIVQDVIDPSAEMVAAGRGTRLGAVLLDGIVFGAMVYLPLLLGMLVGGVTGGVSARDKNGQELAVGLGLALIGGAYWAVLTYRNVKRNGQTIGKKFLNIKVVRTDGSPSSVGRIFWLRNVVNGLLGVIPLYGLIDPLFIFGEARQCLHDKIADTIVIQA